MGYSHYWTNTEEFTEYEWRKLTRFARTLLRGSDIPLSGSLGDHDSSPLITPDAITFNGRSPDDYESFYLVRDPDRGFCKTGRRPYDVFVVAMLEAAAATTPHFTWRSDGDKHDLAAGHELFKRTALETQYSGWRNQP